MLELDSDVKDKSTVPVPTLTRGETGGNHAFLEEPENSVMPTEASKKRAH
jgi:hypothetical protein